MQSGKCQVNNIHVQLRSIAVSEMTYYVSSIVVTKEPNCTA